MNKSFLTIALAGLTIIASVTAIMAQDRWVQGANGQVNGFTLYGGHENGQNLFLCAGLKNGTYHPGKIVGSNCNFGFGGKEVLARSYYTLQVSQQSLKRYSWHKSSYGNVPSKAGLVPIQAGKEGNRILYVCRAAYQNGVHPGKIVGQNCNIGWGGQEIRVPQYEVLMFRTNQGKVIHNKSGFLHKHAVSVILAGMLFPDLFKRQNSKP